MVAARLRDWETDVMVRRKVIEGEEDVSVVVKYTDILLCCNLWEKIPSYSSFGETSRLSK